MRLLILISLVSLNAIAGEVYECKQQEFYIKDTKKGFSTSLGNMPAKEGKAFYLVDGKTVDRESAVVWAKGNMKPIVKVKK